MRRLALALLATAAFTQIASAADLPAKAPVFKAPPGTVVSASGLYLSVDGAWQRLRLPTYALGMRNITALTFIDQGVISPFDPKPNGSNIRGAIGYIFPTGAFSPASGTNVRAELGVSYGRAKGTQSAAAAITANNVSLSFLDGSGRNVAFVCNGGGFTCTTNSTLSSSYDTWQIDGKFASDFRSGGFTLTPSIAVFGGRSRNNQTLSQTFAQTGGNTGIYTASTSVSWSDIGARVGLEGNVDVSSVMSVGLGGYAGVAGRRASLSGNDAGTDSLAGIVFGGASAISIGANTTASVANVEANLTFKPTPAAAIRVFTGVNYDSRVPGISSPTFTPLFVTRTASGITFQSESSYYAGVGGTVRF